MVIGCLDQEDDDENHDLVTSPLIEHEQLGNNYQSCRNADTYNIATDWSLNSHRRDVTSDGDGVLDSAEDNDARFAPSSFSASAYALPLFCLVLIIVYLITYFALGIYHDPTHSLIMRLVISSDVLRLLLFTSALVVTLYGFCLSTRFTSRHVGYSAFTVLFLASTFLLFVYDVMRFMPPSMYLSSPRFEPNFINGSDDACAWLIRPAMPVPVNATHAHSQCVTHAAEWIIIAEIGVHLLQVYSQTSLLVYLSQVAPVPNGVLRQSQYHRFKSILVFLTLFNFYCWVNVSFLSTRLGFADACVYERFYYTEPWRTVWHVIMPIIAFYRFQSFVAFLMYFLKY